MLFHMRNILIGLNKDGTIGKDENYLVKHRIKYMIKKKTNQNAI